MSDLIQSTTEAVKQRGDHPVTEDAAPRPWRVVNGGRDICDRNGMFVAHVTQGVSGHLWPTSRANADLIVKAVNAFSGRGK